ncbi:MAG: hypothetical protein ACLQIB_45910 [Isosphaeraceae bacterium]
MKALLPLYPCALLSVVAFYQYYLVLSSRLDPWKGGGFGMFSSITSLDKQRLRVSLTTSTGQIERFPLDGVAMGFGSSGSLSRLRRELVIHPSRNRLNRLARALAKEQWVSVRGPVPRSAKAPGAKGNDLLYRPRSLVPAAAEATPVALKEIGAEVFEYRLDRHDNRMVLHGLMRVALSVAGEDPGRATLARNAARPWPGGPRQ